jgi:hypothetical protein
MIIDSARVYNMKLSRGEVRIIEISIVIICDRACKIVFWVFICRCADVCIPAPCMHIVEGRLCIETCMYSAGYSGMDYSGGGWAKQQSSLSLPDFCVSVFLSSRLTHNKLR